MTAQVADLGPAAPMSRAVIATAPSQVAPERLGAEVMATTGERLPEPPQGEEQALAPSVPVRTHQWAR